MTSTFPSLFCKGATCPSSQSLLSYHQGRLPAYQLQHVEQHLAACDFCNAELQLLTRHQDNLEEYSFAEMPPHLRTLAESLLKQTAAL
jgi:anti-sigma factor RsiW